MTTISITRDDGKATAIIKAIGQIDEGLELAPIVRCKDCEYYENEECANPYIWMSDGAHLWPDEDFYCAKGERRSDP